jgi:hypothetical protein
MKFYKNPFFVCGEMKILPYFQGIGKVESIELNEDFNLAKINLASKFGLKNLHSNSQ